VVPPYLTNQHLHNQADSADRYASRINKDKTATFREFQKHPTTLLRTTLPCQPKYQRLAVERARESVSVLNRLRAHVDELLLVNVHANVKNLLSSKDLRAPVPNDQLMPAPANVLLLRMKPSLGLRVHAEQERLGHAIARWPAQTSRLTSRPANLLRLLRERDGKCMQIGF
jgi:hypothetical protein